MCPSPGFSHTDPSPGWPLSDPTNHPQVGPLPLGFLWEFLIGLGGGVSLPSPKVNPINSLSWFWFLFLTPP